MKRLDNQQWGFASNCFVCESTNEAGLRIPFFHDEDNKLVTAGFCLTDAFSGAPSYLHGGVILAILDEAMAWACIALAGRFALTEETTTRFIRPLRVGRSYRVEARVEPPGERIAASAVILDDRGRRRADARATFVAMSFRQAGDALGVEPAGTDAAFVEPEPQ